MSEFKGGRIVATQFASNIHRLTAMKKAADLAGRKMCFVGTSLNVYLDAAWRDGRAPFSPKDLLHWSDLDQIDPKEVMIVTTGSQAEPRAALSLAAQGVSHSLKLDPEDLILYSAKVIPGNEKRVMKMMNAIAELGPEIAMGRGEQLHVSGHAYRGELEEILKLVKPQHFLPVHGEYAFLTAHAELAQDLGVKRTSVIRNGQMLGVYDINRSTHVSMGSMQVLGRANLVPFFNDGEKGTGTASEMQLEQRGRIAIEGVVVAAVDVIRRPPAGVDGRSSSSSTTTAVASSSSSSSAALSSGGLARMTREEEISAWAGARLQATIRLTTRAMWVDKGRLLEVLHRAAQGAISAQPLDCSLSVAERVVADAIRRACKDYNKRSPEVIVIAHEVDPRNGQAVLSKMQILLEGASPAERGLRRAGGGGGGFENERGGGARGGRGGRGGRGRGGRGGRSSPRTTKSTEAEAWSMGEAEGGGGSGSGGPSRLPPIRPARKGEVTRAQTPRDDPASAGDDVDLSFG